MEGRLGNGRSGVSEKEYKRQLSTIHFFNGIIEQKSRNWLSFLEQLENATPEGIALASLAPDAKTGAIKLEGRARNFNQIRSYLDHLQDSKAFSDILLLSHSDMAVGEKKNSGVKFVISFRLVKQ